MLMDEYYIRGDCNLKIPAHLHFGKYMLDNLRRMDNEIALVNSATGEIITYKKFIQFSVNLATSLIKLGVCKGDVVALGSEKRILLLPTALSIVFSGATYTPLDLHSGKAVVKHKLSIAQPKYCICSKMFFEKYEDILKSFDCIRIYIMLDDGPNWHITVNSLVSNDVNVQNFEPAKVIGQTDAAFLLYSSGTTGLPKGVRLTHMNCIINSLTDDFVDDNLKTVYISGEWYHNYDTFMTYKFLSLGKKIIFVENVTISEVLQCIHNYQVDIGMFVPFLLNLLCKEDLGKYNLESLKIIYSRASVLHSRTIEKVKQRLPKLRDVIQGYGMTECGELTSENWATKGPKAGSVGMASPGITIKIVATETGLNLGPNMAGEIRVMGPMFMKEYMHIDPSLYLDEEGFFKTGDLGYYDDDKYFFIVDRIKEVIICEGDKVSPAELETILELHPDVSEAGVFGKPDAVYGELPTAFVVKKANSNITEKNLLDYMLTQVAPFMQLRGGVKFTQKLPRSPRGKILRRQLREMLTLSM